MLVKLASVMQRLKKYLNKIFVMIDKDGGGTILRFYGGDTAVMRGDIELMRGDPPVPPLGKTLPNNISNRKLHSIIFQMAYNVSVFTVGTF